MTKMKDEATNENIKTYFFIPKDNIGMSLNGYNTQELFR